MTTTVKRGAGRPAATAKSNRHAQRTPLPAKPEKIQDAKDVIAEARELTAEVHPPQYGYMSQAELHARALELKVGRHDRSGKFIPIAKNTPKGKLLEAILQAERAEAKAAATLRPDPIDAKLDAAFSIQTVKDAKGDQVEVIDDLSGAWADMVNKRLDSKSGAKAEAFVAEAMRLGWTAQAKLGADDHVTVTASRGEERIVIEWIGGVFQDNCTYAHNGRTPIKLRNASAAKQRMAVPPAKANEEAQKVTAHKSAKAKAPRITEGLSGRVLEFVSAAGFRSVLVSQIIRVR